MAAWPDARCGRGGGSGGLADGETPRQRRAARRTGAGRGIHRAVAAAELEPVRGDWPRRSRWPTVLVGRRANLDSALHATGVADGGGWGAGGVLRLAGGVTAARGGDAVEHGAIVRRLLSLGLAGVRRRSPRAAAARRRRGAQRLGEPGYVSRRLWRGAGIARSALHLFGVSRRGDAAVARRPA